MYPSKDTNKCPVHLTHKYLSLCPTYEKKVNFYLRSLEKPTPKQWYAGQVVGSQTLSKVIGKIMELGEFEGFFTNHSARRTGGTRLFRAGVQRKLVKECTGHRSDAVDKYQITSEEQRQKLSEIIGYEHTTEIREVQDPNQIVIDSHPSSLIEKSDVSVAKNNQKLQVDASNVSEIVDGIIKGMKGKDTTRIKIEIEIINERNYKEK